MSNFLKVNERQDSIYLFIHKNITLNKVNKKYIKKRLLNSRISVFE